LKRSKRRNEAAPVSNQAPQKEPGPWIKKEMRGIGLGKEIITHLIHLLEKNFTFQYILYPVDEEKTAGRKIPEKLGFVPYQKYLKNKGDSSLLNIVEHRKFHHD